MRTHRLHTGKSSPCQVLLEDVALNPKYILGRSLLRRCSRQRHSASRSPSSGPPTPRSPSSPACKPHASAFRVGLQLTAYNTRNDIRANPVPSQSFQWVGTDYITYGFAFLGNQSAPVDPSVATDYIPTLVPATNATAAYLRLDYSPGGLPASTGLETGLILDLSDD